MPFATNSMYFYLSQNLHVITIQAARTKWEQMMIETRLSTHAERQAQRRGVAPQTLDLILAHADRSRKLPGKARALWVSRKARERLIYSGFRPSEVDRTRGVRIVIALDDDVVTTVEHMLARRAWA